MEQLQQKVLEGDQVDWAQYGDVRVVYKDNLVLFNYKSEAQFAGRWNWFERVSRGLILDWATGEVVARPFDKFFNWLERGRKASGHMVTVTEKMDGSLGILYRQNGQYKMATRGSFESEQALWATDWLKSQYNLDGLPEQYTLLFEIIYPENRIVVDYGDSSNLFLLAVRDRFMGQYLPFYPGVYELGQHYKFPMPHVFDFNSVTDILSATDTLPATSEGWVAEFSDGQRWKFKGDRYVELHKLVTNASFKKVLEAVADGTYQEMIAGVPDEFIEQIKEWRTEIAERVATVKALTTSAFTEAPKSTRKEFALWAREYHDDLMPYLFLMLDGRDIEPMIYKKAFD